MAVLQEIWCDTPSIAFALQLKKLYTKLMHIINKMLSKLKFWSFGFAQSSLLVKFFTIF